MIFGIIRDGVRSAFVRIVRYIVFAIIALLVIYLIGVFTNKKAHALTQKGSAWDPDITNKERTYSWTNTDSNGQPRSWTQWFEYPLSSNWTINNDYDLVAFKFTRFNYATTQYDNYIDINGSQNLQTGTFWAQISDARPFDYEGTKITVTALYFTPNNTGVSCYESSEVQDVFLCPISRGTVINRFAIIVNVTVPNQKTLYIDTVMERSKYFFNYDSTDIIDYLEDSGVQQIVTQQQQTNEFITNNNTTTSQANATSSLNTISGQFNDVLNGWGGEWSSLTHVVLEPINTILYAFDSGTTCTPITLTIPYLNDGQTITLPCMSSIYGTYFSGFITVFVMIIGGLYGYRTIIYILRTIKEVIDAENDKIEVIDL